LVAPGWTVTAPDVSEISTTDRGNRLLPDLNFNGTLLGAIHNVEINGTVAI
jgi:hypothetical protein